MNRSRRNDVLSIDVCGTVFKTKLSTLKTIPDSRLGNISKTDTGLSLFFDRDPECFKHILSAYRDGELHVPKDVCPQRFRREIEFWEIPIKLLAPCCWKAFYGTDEDLLITGSLLQHHKQPKAPSNKVEEIAENELVSKQINSINKMLKKQENQKCEPRMNQLWLFLEEPASSSAAKGWCFFYTSVILINIVNTLLWAEPSCRTDPYFNNPTNRSYFTLSPSLKSYLTQLYSKHAILFLYSDLHPVLLVIDISTTVFFTIETFIHFLACPMKKHYLKDPYNIVKILLCVTMTATITLEANKKVINSVQRGMIYTIVRCVSVLRFLLIFRLRKLYKGLDILLLAVQSSFKELLLLGFGLIVYVVIYGIMLFSAEALTNNFPSVWTSMWWALITMTTVGYGDFFPTTSLGYIIGTMCALNGLIMLALPVAAIASNFSNFYAKHYELERHLKEVNEQMNSNRFCAETIENDHKILNGLNIASKCEKN